MTQGLSTVVEKRLRKLVGDHKAQLSRLDPMVKAVETAMKNTTASLEDLKKHQAKISKRFEAKVADLIGMANDPVVLVRNYGASDRTYHSLRQACGKANPNASEQMLWGEAKKEGYRPCSFCGWYADKDAEEVHAETAS